MFGFCKKPAADYFVFDDDALQAIAEKHKGGYNSAAPFPHAMIDDFMPRATAERLLSIFPDTKAPIWFDWSKGDVTNQPRKQGIGHAKRLAPADPYIHNIMQAFNSYPFIHFLETLTGIDGLIPDPHLMGGGLHQILPGGILKVHADFNYHEKLRLYRRINVLLYLNKDWDESFGGAIELWDREMKGAVQKIYPLFNRCVVFNTDSHSYHGHPDPLACPEGRTRKSVAFYYYTVEKRESDNEHHSTLWQERPNVS